MGDGAALGGGRRWGWATAVQGAWRVVHAFVDSSGWAPAAAVLSALDSFRFRGHVILPTRCGPAPTITDPSLLSPAAHLPAVVGPPRSHAGPFAWSSSGSLAERVPHVGQPDEFAYDFERMSPDPLRWLAR